MDLEDREQAEVGSEEDLGGGGRPAHVRALAVEQYIRKAQKRAARQSEGRCPYCGRLPEAGRTACARCREAQRRRNAAKTARRQAERLAEARAKGPRRCGGCDSENLATRGSRGGRPRFRCRDCGRHSLGDGIPPPRPVYPCPYCKKQCRVRRQKKGNRTEFYCPACRRYNTNLWPADAPSPGGPFPHYMNFGLNYAAHIGLMAYGQVKGMSEAQAIRDIFIRAATKPIGYVSRAHSARPVRFRYERYATESSGSDAWDDGEDVVTTIAIPPPAPPTIPPGGVRFPNLVPEMNRKFTSQKGAAYRCPTVAVIRRVTLVLNDAVLAGLRVHSSGATQTKSQNLLLTTPGGVQEFDAMICYSRVMCPVIRAPKKPCARVKSDTVLWWRRDTSVLTIGIK